jgi:hypothetical protein
MDMGNLRFTQATRKHKIGRASVVYVIDHFEATDTFTPGGTPMKWWVGEDERGRELEVGAIAGPRDGCCLVIHVFPTALRDKE